MAGKHDELASAWRRMGPVAWAESEHGWIVPSGGPVLLTAWQRAVLLAWWEYRADVRTLAISLTKKTGKTFENALLLAWRWLALPGEHLALGNDLDQSAGRQFAEVAKMVARNPYLKRNCTVGKKQITFNPTGSTITALAADAAGNAGANHLTASSTETWGVIAELGIRAFEELAPPPLGPYGDNFPPMRVCDSYAGYTDQSNTWHGMVDAGLLGEPVSDDWPIYLADGLLLFHMEGAEARERCFRGTPEQARRYYDSERRTLRPMAWQRFHENQRTSGAEAFITEGDWRAIEDPALQPLPPGKRVPLYAGVDLATKHDNAAVMGVIPNGTRRARIALHKIWKPLPDAPVSLAGVRAYLLDLHRMYWLAGVFYDPSQAQLLAEDLRGQGVRMIEVPQSLPELGPRGTKLWEAVRDCNLSTYPNDELRAAATAAVAKEVPQGLHIVKGTARRKIDPIAALSFALPAALETYASLPAHQPEQRSRWTGAAAGGAVSGPGADWGPDELAGGYRGGWTNHN